MISNTAANSQPLCWFAARTRYGQEVGIKNRLSQMGVEHFIPVSKSRNSRGRITEKAVINNLVFIRASKQEACSLKTEARLPLNYIFDYAAHTMLTVPEKQMDDFMRVFEYSISEGGLMDTPLELGERVRVTKGPLEGVVGNVLELQGKLYVVVGLCMLVYAKAKIPRAWLERVN